MFLLKENKTLLFSIIVPVFNSEKYITICLDSILNQTYSSFEIIIVNDGSTDRSKEICESYCERDSRIRLFNKENGGQFSSRLLGIKMAKGDYLIPVDSDDTIRRDTLEVLNNYIVESSADLVIFGGSKESTYSCPIYKLGLSCEKTYSGNEKKAIYDILLAQNYLNSFCMKAYSRELVSSISWDNSTLSEMRNGEDMMQLLPVLTESKRIGYCDEILYYYRQNNTSVSRIYKPQMYDSREIIYRTLFSYREKWGICTEESIEALKLRTLRNVVSIIKMLKSSNRDYAVSELKRIGNDEWGRKIYISSDKKELKCTERAILFLLYHHFPQLLMCVLKNC
ncbi:MAG: glycosyltransferase [Clostridia bacterium]|nr:glycosyltransferase [Clostridia bacterium]